MHQVLPCDLKISFCQFRLDEQLSQLEVHFTSILCAILQGDSRPEAECRMNARLDSEQGTDRRTAQYSRITKNVHQQRIRAVRTLQLAPCAIGLSGQKSRAGIDLGQPRLPSRLLQNSLV